MTRVAVLGARGRMGSTSVAAIEASDDLEVVCEIDIDDSLDQITQAGAQEALIFTTPDVALDHARWCIERGIDVVIGTSGFDESKIAELREAVEPGPDRPDPVGVLVVPNFSIGAVLLTRFAELAAPYFESVEVIEMHHPQKVDAPSGTAVHTAEVIARARAEASLAPPPDATTDDPLGSRGALVESIPVHAIRARGFIASQEVLLGGEGEILSLRHDSSTRESFMPGVLAALRAAPTLPGVTVGLGSVLGLP